jgi:DNA-binding NtrC family response regulator
MADRSVGDYRVRVLVVSPLENDVSALSRILGHSAWIVESVRSVAAAKEVLSDDPACVVLCERTLPDGDWKDLFAATCSMDTPPQLIVICGDPSDRLWAEVLNLGAYDVLAKPFYPQEVYRVIGVAWRHWLDAQRTHARKMTVQSELGAAVEPRRAVVGSAR